MGLARHYKGYHLGKSFFSYQTRIRTLAQQRGFTVNTLHPAPGEPLTVLTRHSPKDVPSLYLSAGIHGNEPSGVFAIHDLLLEGALDEAFHWTILPCINVAGILAGTREHPSGIDLNRDFREPASPIIRALCEYIDSATQPFDMAMHLHEDWEPDGFYLYELDRRQGAKSIGDTVVDEVGKNHPIAEATTIDGHAAENGIIRPVVDPQTMEIGWPEAIYLTQGRCKINLTFETPSRMPISERIQMQSCAVKAALHALRNA